MVVDEEIGGRSRGAERKKKMVRSDGDISKEEENEMRELQEMLSNLNPLAREFVPPSLTNSAAVVVPQNPFFHHQYHHHHPAPPSPFAVQPRQRRSNPRRKQNKRTGQAQSEEVIRRTVFVSDIDHLVTEEQLASLFIQCGQVVDCRICGDPNSVLRFAFIEFTDLNSACAALSLSGTMLGFYPVKVLPSKTAIAPVNPTFLPQSENERDMCVRTIYCTNIDKKVTEADIKFFFESVCGQVYRLRVLGDHRHSTRIAFVEFIMAESATAALNCSGVVLGSSAIRVSPSKTPVRPRTVKQSSR